MATAAGPDAESRHPLRPADEGVERGIRRSRDIPRPLPYVDFASRGDNNNIAPRLGVAWDLHSDGRSVIRGGYGVIYTNAQHNLVAGEGSAFQQYTITIRNPSYPDPYQGRDPLSFVSTAPPNITIGANNLVNAPAQTANVGFSKDIGRGGAIHLDGVYTRIDDLPTNVRSTSPTRSRGWCPCRNGATSRRRSRLAPSGIGRSGAIRQADVEPRARIPSPTRCRNRTRRRP